jgi:RNA-directed DNA polymerase
MSLGQLLFDLKALLVDPVKNRAKIEQRLRYSRKLAEYEVARFYVAQKGVVPTDFEQQLRSRDPRVRRAAAKTIDLFMPRGDVGRFLRIVLKDPDPETRATAFRALRRLQLTEVSIPDPRYKPSRRVKVTTPGAWNPSGWLFGLYRRKVKKNGRPADVTKNKLPPLAKTKDVLKLLDIADDAALTRLRRAGTGKGSPYVEFEIDKATGGKRAIAAPRAPLRKVQRVILRKILDKLPMHDAAHGFVKGRSTVTNAKPHEGAQLVVKLDLVDFFPTVHFRRVRGVFGQLGYSEEVSHLLASLCTYRPVLEDGYVAWPGVLPQGAPTSPTLANLACRRLDARLAALAKKSGAAYTRYADDLTFSFANEPKTLGRFLWWVDQICQQEGFSENARKRRVLRKKTQQRVTGIVVNSGLFVPRRDRHRFRAILKNVKKNGVAAEAKGNEDFAAYLRGFAAYVKMVQPELGARWVAEVKALLAK